MAFATAALWGSTFVFTKVLLIAGLSPADIFTLRFIIAYGLLALVSYGVGTSADSRKVWSRTWCDEFIMLTLGLTGGSLYFLTENAAMLFTTATNTSLIVCSCPLFTMLIYWMVYRDASIRRNEVVGTLISLAGMVFVVMNGHFVLHLSPVGDMLAFAACLCWAIYSLIIKQVSEKYSSIFITRKVFFYGLLTMIPYYMVVGSTSNLGALREFHVISSLLFLGCVASFACFLTWNWVIKNLGPITTTNWVYFNPVTTIVFASWILNERITFYFLIGTVCILSGMFIAARK